LTWEWPQHYHIYESSSYEDGLKNGGTTGTVGPAKDNGLTCYNCGQVVHISHNCPNRDVMKMLLEQALVAKDASKDNSGHPRKDKKQGCAMNGRKESGRLAEEKEANQ